jgi:hypothetical protein
MAEKLQLTLEDIDAMGSDAISEAYKNATQILDRNAETGESCINCYTCDCVCECFRHYD